MAAPYRVALLGLSAFERNALVSYFRLTANRVPHYAQVRILNEADLMVADAEHAPSVGVVTATDRLADTVFLGAGAPPDARACLPRPIEPLQVLLALDALVAARSGRPPPLAADEGRRRTLIEPRRAAPAEPTPEPPPFELTLRAEFAAPELPAPPAETTAGMPAELLREPPAEPAREAPREPAREPPRESQAEALPAATALLARRAAALAEDRPDAALAAPAPPFQALLVDDSDIAQRFLQRLLERYGLGVDCARSSEEALERVARHHYYFVFVDKELGPSSALDGLGVCRSIRRLQSAEAAPSTLVMVTAHDNEVERTRAEMAGCDAFLGKPIDEQQLEQLLADHGLTRQPAAPPA